MTHIYKSPLRVYLALACLALWGLFSGWQLPISLFPNSTKPKIEIDFSYGGLTPDEFMNNYGKALEGRLKAATFGSHEPESVTASYDPSEVNYRVEYKWGTPPREALREIESVTNSFATQLPTEIRDSLSVWSHEENSGFLAVSFYSTNRSLDDLYKYLEPILAPRLGRVTEAESIQLWNPNHKEVRIQLNPEKMALLHLMPSDIVSALAPTLQSRNGGSVTAGLSNLDIILDRQATDLQKLARIPLLTPSGQAIHLSDVAQIDLETPSHRQRLMKTSGVPSLILFASPRAGGNIKKMAEDTLQIIAEIAPTLPEDVEYRVLVDPSEFIRSAVNNVLHEVFLAALLAVVVLFVFIGNFRNVMTAAIEIPMSIVLAFILMRWFGINLNLISLGGLALSAGMNVDASVVVMENIFRHFDEWKGPLRPAHRLAIVLRAVEEVRFPVIASTIASLVVFLPLAMTSGLTNAILGDLAMAVVFSHGFSAFVALILVPTVRLHMMSGRTADTTGHSPIEPWLHKLETLYTKALSRFLSSTRLKAVTYGTLLASLVLLFVFVLPRLPREIIGTPDTDWIYLGVNTSGNSLVRQMESQVAETEARLFQKLGHRIAYTFTQINQANRAHIMARLKNKNEMNTVLKEIETEFTNTPFRRFFVMPWNPSELPIPNPPHLRLVVRGNEARDRALVAEEVMDLIDSKKIYSDVWTEPSVSRKENVILRPNPEQWSALATQGARFRPSDLADLSRVATVGRPVGEMPIGGVPTQIVLRYPEGRVNSIEDLAALPIGFDGKLLPLSAMLGVRLEQAPPSIYREDGKALVVVKARLTKENESKHVEALKQVEDALKTWQNGPGKNRAAVVIQEDARKELNEALEQLGYAVGLSVLLIFLTMVFQFGDLISALLVLVAIPLGFIGVLASLFVFKSTLSLNSVLGIILLNGISVANSIILVDFLKRLVEQGLVPREAALEAAQKRVQPILMTSLTTGLGMLPIALGLGEGGRILQPLGIAVIGGLGFSMLMTLFVVPSLQVGYLEWRRRRRPPSPSPTDDHLSIDELPIVEVYKPNLSDLTH